MHQVKWVKTGQILFWKFIYQRSYKFQFLLVWHFSSLFLLRWVCQWRPAIAYMGFPTRTLSLTSLCWARVEERGQWWQCWAPSSNWWKRVCLTQCSTLEESLGQHGNSIHAYEWLIRDTSESTETGGLGELFVKENSWDIVWWTGSLKKNKLEWFS